MTEVIVTAAAEADYLEGLVWYAKRSLQAARGFEREFDRSLEAIAAAPVQFAKCDERHRRYLMRRYPYQVVYRDEGERIAVVAVAHAKRKPAYWRGR